ncbi:MAG: hypothetical protein EBZ58_04720 [Bacteroidetes bacterium]|nr:hypothetical protein [Bacteroidota bacterium]
MIDWKKYSEVFFCFDTSTPLSINSKEPKNQDCPKILENVICFFLAAHTKSSCVSKEFYVIKEA